ncbi:MAG: glycerol acyltransferase [Cytophagales bacterium]|nr:glycerol acyltransferase [Cytophagales bacterium]
MNFDDIRPYHDAEVPAVLHRLQSDAHFQQLMAKALPQFAPGLNPEALLQGISSIHDFQIKAIYAIGKLIIKHTTDGLSHSGLSELDPDKAYLFISNHRDIVLDSAFLNIILTEQGWDTTRIAIGDNLLIYPWITDLVKLNKSFVVRRKVSGISEKLRTAQNLSAYIRHSITQDRASVWIAQREGRTKNGVDQTQTALVRMLDLSGTQATAINYTQLNIVPISISYELESCDDLKARELLLAAQQGGRYEKTPGDDLKSMAQGISQAKGRVHFHFGTPLEALPSETPKNQVYDRVTALIDEQVVNHYHLWPINWVAYHELTGDEAATGHYTHQEKEKALAYLNQVARRTELPAEDMRRQLLELYANPVIRQQEQNKKPRP